jgi:hypothetical protein
MSRLLKVIVWLLVVVVIGGIAKVSIISFCEKTNAKFSSKGVEV